VGGRGGASRDRSVVGAEGVPGVLARRPPGAFDASAAEALRTAARDAGAMYSLVQLLDWTHLGSFRHDDPDAFFGDAEPTAGDG